MFDESSVQISVNLTHICQKPFFKITILTTTCFLTKRDKELKLKLIKTMLW